MVSIIVLDAKTKLELEQDRAPNVIVKKDIGFLAVVVDSVIPLLGPCVEELGVVTRLVFTVELLGPFRAVVTIVARGIVIG